MLIHNLLEQLKNMNIKFKKLPKSEISLTIEISPENFEQYKKLAIKKLNEEIKMPGFRPGHIPEEILETRLGRKEFKNYIMTNIGVPKSYADAVILNKLETIERPKINILSKTPFIYEATVAIMPQVKLKNYKKIKIPKIEQKVSSEDIEKVKKSIQREAATYKEKNKEETTREGDRVEIDFEGFDENEAKIKGLHSRNYPLIIGENLFLPEFEKQLVGMKKDQEKEISATFPKDWHYKALQNKKVTYKVTIQQVEKVILPDLNEEFIQEYSLKKYGSKKTNKEFEQFLEKEILEEKENEEKTKRKEKVFEELLKYIHLEEIPDVLMKEVIEEIKKERKNHKDSSDSEKVTEDNISLQDKKNIQEQGEKRIKLHLGLKEIVKRENLSVSDDEVQKKIEKIVDFLPRESKNELRKLYLDNNILFQDLRTTLLLEKFYDFLLEKKA